MLIVSVQPQRRDEDDGLLRGGAVGVIDWLHKPIDPSRVMEVIRACLQLGGSKPRILHVEDDDDLRVLLARQIAMLDVELAGAATLQEARQLISAQPFDLAIIDLMLPDGDGTELFDQLAQSIPPPGDHLFRARHPDPGQPPGAAPAGQVPSRRRRAGQADPAPVAALATGPHSL